MTGSPPTRVSLYAYVASDEHPVAEFRWNAESGVTLTILNADWSRLAQEYFTQGAPLDREQRVVPAAEGEAFMRALLEPRQMTYYAFVDESTAAPGTGYCEIFVRADGTAATVLAMLAEALSGEVQRRSLRVPGLVIDVRPNPDSRPTGDPGDDFVRWPVTVEVSAEGADRSTLVDTVARILTALWGSGQPAVAACDFEAELPWAGGIGRLREGSR
jgi:hypothetical protein